MGPHLRPKRIRHGLDWMINLGRILSRRSCPLTPPVKVAQPRFHPVPMQRDAVPGGERRSLLAFTCAHAGATLAPVAAHVAALWRHCWSVIRCMRCGKSQGGTSINRCCVTAELARYHRHGR